MPLLPSPSRSAAAEAHKRRTGRNWALFFILLILAFIFYGLSLVRLKLG